MRDEYIKHGEILPTIFPAGTNNPMGMYALYLEKNYAIHGTNSNFGIGLRITRGCIRLRPEDIEYLFNIVPIGTKVRFINEPVKSTVEENGMRYLEIHNPLSCGKEKNQSESSMIAHLKQQIQSILIDENDSNVDYEIINKELKARSGIPINITNKLANNKNK